MTSTAWPPAAEVFPPEPLEQKDRAEGGFATGTRASTLEFKELSASSTAVEKFGGVAAAEAQTVLARAAAAMDSPAALEPLMDGEKFQRRLGTATLPSASMASIEVLRDTWLTLNDWQR
jgi:hypothetical protein